MTAWSAELIDWGTPGRLVPSQMKTCPPQCATEAVATPERRASGCIMVAIGGR
jgi:hypothetical protein